MTCILCSQPGDPDFMDCRGEYAAHPECVEDACLAQLEDTP